MNTDNKAYYTNIEGYDSLVKLALDMRSSWNHAADTVWRKLDPAVWERTHNPWGVLQAVSPDQLKKSLADPAFRKKVLSLVESRDSMNTNPAWFQRNHPDLPLTCIAYFSMEFMLSESLPIYSGGLGNVAGDQLKAASDLGVPVVGIGLLYQLGNFHQEIDNEGMQQVRYPINDPEQLPVRHLHRANGEMVRFVMAVPGFSVWLKVWEVQVGRVKLYLLDSNDVANTPAHRGITSELYGGGPELRLQQELVLGIGGWQLLDVLGMRPDVCHLNEGHAAFAVLERALSFMKETGHPFTVALASTRAGNLFTTHTAVTAGFDRFAPSLIEQYLGAYAEQQLGISLYDLLALGRCNPDDMAEHFNMAYLAVHGSGAVSGVSRLHGEVSRHIFEPLFPHWPVNEVPVGYVTNGVHMPSWDSADADDLWTETCGKQRWQGTTETMEQNIRSIADDRLWKLRTDTTRELVDYTRERLSLQLAASGAPSDAVDEAKHVFNPDTLTLGFARRFATYKRPDLLLYDPDRFLRLLSDPQRPVQLIIAGKAHPADKAGQALIQKWIRFIRRPDVRPHVVFLSDYDMQLTERLVQGVDVWINTPRRPWEACGTSGMKVLVNGGVNISELDGWWAEAYAPEVGWALGDSREHGDDPAWDATEAGHLYTLLEREVIPEFYTRNKTGIPVAWINRMRESMAQLTPRFCANRAVSEYVERYYIPAASAFHLRSADNGSIGRNIVDWQQGLGQKWARVRFGEVTMETHDGRHRFEVRVHFAGLDTGMVRMELYADGISGGAPVRHTMKLAGQSVDAADGHFVYRAEVSAARPATDYTTRALPYFDGVAVPLEEVRILWQR